MAPWWAREDSRKDVPLFMPEFDLTDRSSAEFYLNNLILAGRRYRMWWRMFLKAYPAYADKCPVWHLFEPDDWMAILWEQPGLGTRCNCWHTLPREELILLFLKYPELKPLAENTQTTHSDSPA